MRYEGQLTILRDFVRPLRQQPKKQAILRLETPPRKQAQMGLAYVRKYLVNDTLQDVYVCRIQTYTSLQY
jgi:transposase